MPPPVFHGILFASFLFLPLLVPCVVAQTPASPRWFQVTDRVGIGATEGDKTSPPAIADLNQDGFLDIVMCNHARQEFEIFYGGSERFTRKTFFAERQDRHGVALGDFDSDGDIDILLTIGGTNGRVPAVPVMGVSQSPTQTMLRTEGRQLGLATRPMRGVAARFVDIDSDGDLDLFILSRPPLAGGPAHAVYENIRGRFVLRPDTGLEFGRNLGMIAMDYDSDGNMDILLLGLGIQFWKGDGRFNFVDRSNEALSGARSAIKRPFLGVSAFDVDNDGDMDIYLGAGQRDKKGRAMPFNDVLLENRNGTFVDVSRQYRLPRGGTHLGITTGDFNNDGFQDVFLPRAGSGTRRIQDLLLLNTGRRSFQPSTTHGANGSPDFSYGNGAQALDYNRDGRLDIVVSARQTPNNGRLRLYRNGNGQGNSFTVSLPVLSASEASTMDAIVTIDADGKRYTRSCGSGQGEFRTQSMITDVHFGIGRSKRVDRVVVTLTTGTSYAFAGPFQAGRFTGFALPMPDGFSPSSRAYCQSFFCTRTTRCGGC